MITPTSDRLILFSALLALFSLGFMTLAFVSREPFAVTAALSIGQGLGLLSLALYGWAVVRDMRKAKLVAAEREPDERS